MGHYDFLVIVGLLPYIAFSIYEVKRDMKAIREKLDKS